MQKITFEQFIAKILKYRNKDLYIDILTFVNTLIVIDKSKMIINNYRIIFTDGKDIDVEIDSEQISLIELSDYGNVFKLYFGIEGTITLNFDINS